MCVCACHVFVNVTFCMCFSTHVCVCLYMYMSFHVCRYVLCMFTVLTHYVHFLTLKKNSQSHDRHTLSLHPPPSSTHSPFVPFSFIVMSVNALSISEEQSCYQRRSCVCYVCVCACAYVCVVGFLFFLFSFFLWCYHTHTPRLICHSLCSSLIGLTLRPRTGFSQCLRPLWSVPEFWGADFQSVSPCGSIYLPGPRANPSTTKSQTVWAERLSFPFWCLKKS